MVVGELGMKRCPLKCSLENLSGCFLDPVRIRLLLAIIECKLDMGRGVSWPSELPAWCEATPPAHCKLDCCSIRQFLWWPCISCVNTLLESITSNYVVTHGLMKLCVLCVHRAATSARRPLNPVPRRDELRMSSTSSWYSARSFGAYTPENFFCDRWCFWTSDRVIPPTMVSTLISTITSAILLDALYIIH